MKSKFWAAAPVLLLFSSCGIETVAYLSPPSTSYTSQTDFTKLTISAGNYDTSTDFRGYEVYYRIYAQPTSGQFDILAWDVQRLAATPTLDYLILMGYQRLGGNVNNSGTLPLISNPSSGSTVTLDFSAFTSVNRTTTISNYSHTGTPLPPLPTVQNGAGGTPFPVYRTVSTSVTPPWFSDLYATPFTALSDMLTTAPNDSSFPSTPITQSTQYYQICVFIVAYAFTPEKTTYSQPEPWGVIGGDANTYLKVFQ